MQALAVARATPNPKVAVTGRTLLWRTGVFDVKVPRNANIDSFVGDSGTEREFAQFPCRFEGGLINLYVFAKEPHLLCGTTITATLELYRRDYDNGRSFLALEFTQVDQPATHRFVIEPRQNVLPPKGAQVFQSPEPLKSRVFITVLKSMQGFKAVSTGYPTVDRMINAEGWQIDHETATEIHLKKAGGKTTTFHKPKSKNKKKER